MEFRHEHQFAATVAQVSAMLADPEFAEVRAQAGGSTSYEATVDGAADGTFTVAVRRVVPASSIPTEMRSLVGSTLTVFYTEAWGEPDGVSRTGTFAVEIVGAPGHLRGVLGLTDELGTAAFVASGEVKVNVPLFGAMIERTLADAFSRGLSAELAEADAWLARQ